MISHEAVTLWCRDSLSGYRTLPPCASLHREEGHWGGGGPPASLLNWRPTLARWVHQRDEKLPGIYNHHCCHSKIQQVLCFDGHWAKNSNVLPMCSCTKMSVLASCSSNMYMYIYIWVSATRKELPSACDCVKHLTFQIKNRQTEHRDQAETTSQLHLFNFFQRKCNVGEEKCDKKTKIWLVWCQTSSTIEHTLSLKCSTCCMNYHHIIQFRVIKVKLGAKLINYSCKLTSFSLDFFF